MTRIRLAMAEASRQAPWRSLAVSRLVKVGIKAEASAPPATRLKSVSDTRLAALKASMAELVPKAFSTTTWRIRPIRLLRMKAAMTSPAARAIWRLAAPAETLTVEDYIRGRPPER
jgi:hypothetical protein